MGTLNVSYSIHASSSSPLTSSPPKPSSRILPPFFHHRTNIKNSTLLLYKSKPTSSLHQLQPQPQPQPQLKLSTRIRASVSSAMATGVKEILPPALTSTSEPPPIFDGTTRLYISYFCPFAQRVWITRNCKGLQDQIKLVPIDLHDRPAWYKEKVYPPNKVPSLEHNNEVKGESLDLVKYIESHFEGPKLLPDDPNKKEFAEELFTYTDTFTRSVFSLFKGEGDDQATAAFGFIEEALSKFDNGPFFLGQFSIADIAYAPFIERFQPYLLEVKKIDITEGRPKLAAWIEEMNKIDAYNQTRRDPKELVESYKKRFGAAL